MSLGQNAEPGDWSGYRVPGCKRWGLWLGLSTIPFIFAFHLVDLAREGGGGGVGAGKREQQRGELL